MIDKHAFAAGMGLLSGAFNRTVDAPVSRVYYSVLSSRLTTEQFEAAVQRVLIEETFWPSPALILAKTDLPSTQRNAAEALEHVSRVMDRVGGFRNLPHAMYHAEFDAPTKAAISAVGGLSRIAETPVERWAGLAKRFSEAYLKALQPRLPQPITDPRVAQLVKQVAGSISAHPLSRRDRAAGERAE